MFRTVARGERLVTRARIAFIQWKVFSVVVSSAWNNFLFALRSLLLVVGGLSG